MVAARQPNLARMRDDNERLMPEPATVGRAGTPLDPQPTMTNGAPLRVRVLGIGQSPTPGGTLLDQQERWLITLPYALDIKQGDQITALGGIYAVAVVDNPDSFDIGTQVICYRVAYLDSDGNPVQLIPLPNAVVTITGREGEDTTTVAAPARIEAPQPRDMLVQGGSVKYTVLLPVDANTQLGDLLYILSWAPFPIDPNKAYRVLAADPEGDLTAAWVRCVIAERE